MSFPANALLKREELETMKISGTSIIAGLHHGHGKRALMYSDAPFDLLYGFRGKDDQVDLLTPYEMLMWYQPERILAPLSENINARSTWTEEGAKYRALCKELHFKPDYKPGIHYVATPAKNRILLADYPALRGLSPRLVLSAARYVCLVIGNPVAGSQMISLSRPTEATAR